MIRAGTDGENEALALDQGVSVIGWSNLGEIPAAASRDDLKQLIKEVYGEDRDASLASQAGQVYRFINEVKIGDVVVLPRKSESGKYVAVGRITGAYLRREDPPFAGTDAQNTRATDWIEHRLPYHQFDSDLQATFRQQGTISLIDKPYAVDRILAGVRAPRARST